MPEEINWKRYFWTLGIMVLTSPLFFLFDSLGKPGNGRAAWIGAGMILIVMKVRWELRKHKWFWLTMFFIVAAHVPLVVFAPWTSRWIPAVGILPIGVADIAVMFGCLHIIEKWMRVDETSDHPGAASRADSEN